MSRVFRQVAVVGPYREYPRKIGAPDFDARVDELRVLASFIESAPFRPLRATPAAFALRNAAR